jgi:hypothetical protein
VLINLSVAELAAGMPEASAHHLAMASQLNQTMRDPIMGAAIIYNYAEALLQSGNTKRKPLAARWLNQYLKAASPASTWWGLGFDRYSSLCGETKMACQNEQQFRVAKKLYYRPLPAIAIKVGLQVQLGDSMDEVKKSLGESELVPIFRDSNLKRMRYPKFGVEVIGTDEVIAISLNSAASPEIKLQTIGLGEQTRILKVGMTQQQVKKVLGPGTQPSTVFDPNVLYRFYPEVGLVARYIRGRVAEFLVVVIPRDTRV